MRSGAPRGWKPNPAELIAVEGAAPYWRALGFTEPSIPPALAAKVAAYGPAARWMSRPLAPLD